MGKQTSAFHLQSNTGKQTSAPPAEFKTPMYVLTVLVAAVCFACFDFLVCVFCFGFLEVDVNGSVPFPFGFSICLLVYASRFQTNSQPFKA